MTVRELMIQMMDIDDEGKGWYQILINHPNILGTITKKDIVIDKENKIVTLG